MVITNKNGDIQKVNIKPVYVDDIGIIITKWYPNGKKSSKFYHGYEATTGHWIGIGKTKEDVVQRVHEREKHINKILKGLDDNIGGLFG